MVAGILHIPDTKSVNYFNINFNETAWLLHNPAEVKILHIKMSDVSQRKCPH